MPMFLESKPHETQSLLRSADDENERRAETNEFYKSLPALQPQDIHVRAAHRTADKRVFKETRKSYRETSTRLEG
jgi:hypothetical protein